MASIWHILRASTSHEAAVVVAAQQEEAMSHPVTLKAEKANAELPCCISNFAAIEESRDSAFRSETDAILALAGIDWRPFSPGAVAELPVVPDAEHWNAAPAEASWRRDLRGPEYLVFSIDPPG